METPRSTDKNAPLGQGYLAPVMSVDLPNRGDYSFTVAIVLGDVDAIRAVASERRPPDGGGGGERAVSILG